MADLRIFLADDHAVVREGLKALINAEPGMAVVGEAADGRSACEQIPALRPDVAGMDLSMPGLTGPQATERHPAVRPQGRVLATPVHEHRVYSQQLLAAR